MFTRCWTPLRIHGWVSHLHRPGKHAYLTYGLHHHMGSSQQSLELWQGSDSPGNPRFVQLHGLGPCDPGNLTISCIMNVIKEKEIDALAMLWVKAQVAYLLVVWCATGTVEDNRVAMGVSDPIEYDEMVNSKETEMIDAFSSHIIHAKIGSACTGTRVNMMTQALCAKDVSLPQGLTIQNAYTEMHNGSKNVTIIGIVQCILRLWRRRSQWQEQLQPHGCPRHRCSLEQ